MNSSDWLAKKQKYEKEKETVKKINVELNAISSGISSIPDKLISSENFFRNGGYFDGDTLDRGALKIISSDFSSYISKISNLIAENDILIEKLEKEIVYCEDKYRECLKEEESE